MLPQDILIQAANELLSVGKAIGVYQDNSGKICIMHAIRHAITNNIQNIEIKNTDQLKLLSKTISLVHQQIFLKENRDINVIPSWNDLPHVTTEYACNILLAAAHNDFMKP